jgi:pSer/pThr/pTyr-binding forkhead associated (FHA) protein
MTLGRAKDCEIVLPERQVSRYHARIEHDESGFILRDLGSKNGTFVNGNPVRGQPYRLHDGDEIALAADVQMGFVAGEATLPLEDISDLDLGDHLNINKSARQVCLGREILDPPLSPAQYALLVLLKDADGDVVTRDEVIEAVWPDAVGGVTDQALDALIYRLRERLVELDPDHNYVVTVRGHGFRYEHKPFA